MQDKNKSFQIPPKPGDGTQPAPQPREEANKFGTSHEPQEEYLETVPSPGESPGDSSDLELLKDKRLSEGEPTF